MYMAMKAYDLVSFLMVASFSSVTALNASGLILFSI